MENLIQFLKLNQLNIDQVINESKILALKDIEPFKGKVIKVNYIKEGGFPNSVYGVIDDVTPIEVAGGVIKLCLLNYRPKDYRVEKRKRVVSISTIEEIKIIGEFKINIDTIKPVV